MAKLKNQYGDSIEIAPEFQYEWVSIPHIYNTPFYCYAYSFGQLLVLSLSLSALSRAGRGLYPGLHEDAGLWWFGPSSRDLRRDWY